MESLDKAVEKFTSEGEEREKTIPGDKKIWSWEDFFISLSVNSRGLSMLKWKWKGPTQVNYWIHKRDLWVCEAIEGRRESIKVVGGEIGVFGSERHINQ